jgi:uncharacterized OB-fold protein
MKMILIRRCGDCHYYDYRDSYCHHRGKSGARSKRKVKDTRRIYSWCPLDDYFDENIYRQQQMAVGEMQEQDSMK